MPPSFRRFETSMDLDQAGAVPFRRLRDGKLEFCLVTSLRRGVWMFPKGNIDPGETLTSTALKESWEEAGVRGALLGAPLGVCEYEKFRRWRRVLFLLMEVTRVEPVWPEARIRKRRWATPQKVARLLAREEQRPLFQQALERLSGTTGYARELTLCW